MWEQELYNEMRYKNTEPSFHTFEGDKGMIGIYFADIREATQFESAVRFRLSKIQKRRSLH